MISYGKQYIDNDDIESVIKVLKSDYLTQGPTIEEFESKIAQYCGASYCSATSSATAALHLACLALDVTKDDIIWTSAISFVASANCALYCGASVSFLDINLDNNNICMASLEEKLQFAQKNNALPKAIIVVHMSGLSCDMRIISQLAIKYKFKVIEDASHALGGDYLTEKIGSCKYSDICVFSLHPVKIITTGEGGLILTNNPIIKSKVDRLRSHGITKKQNEFTEPSLGDWYYEQQELGFNYRMTDIQAALGISQLIKLDNFIVKRRSIAQKYNSLLAPHKEFIQTPSIQDINQSSNHLYIIKLPAEKRNFIFNKLKQNGILCQVHYIPIYKHPYHSKLLPKGFSLHNSEKYYFSAISLPIFPTLSFENVTTISNIIIRWIKN